MNTILNLKKVSLAFFIITGLLHLSSSILIANQILLKQSYIINKTMDIPFVLTGLMYGLASLRMTFTDPEKEHKLLDIFMISIIIVVLVSLMAINLLIPNIA